MGVDLGDVDLGEYVRAEFGLGTGGPVRLDRGPRGALGQVWRLEVGGRVLAVKELFDPETPDEALIATEVDFTVRAAAAGVAVAASHAAIDGRYAIPMPAGRSGWIRVYDWLDARRVDPTDRAPAARLGTLVARLHLAAPDADRELDGSPPDDWYDTPPPADVWPELVASAEAAGSRWAPDLAARVDLIREISALAVPADPAAMVVCHRDLHPENVLLRADGELTVVDWDNLGPAEPGRELVRILLDWWYADGTLDAAAVGAMLSAYQRIGGTGRVAPRGARPTAAGGFVIASRLNFLALQVRAALDPAEPERHREWAVREIDEALRILPTPEVLDRLAAIERALPGPGGA